MLQLLLAVASILMLNGQAADSAEKGRNWQAKTADAHFLSHGVRLPSRKFVEALRRAAINTSPYGCGRSLVLLAMANEEALQHTVPLFLKGLGKLAMPGVRQRDQPLDGGLVVMVWSQAALDMCLGLQNTHRHHCVWDTEHRGANGSFAFHGSAFNALGFAKVKYILNGLSTGHDVVFLDTDIVMLRNPLPYFYTRGAVMYAALEKCLVIDDTAAFHSPQFLRFGDADRRVPLLNIGVLFFRATAGVMRCVYDWIWDMYGEVAMRPKIWDQDIYGKQIHKCAEYFDQRWQPLDPRLFQSACFPGCGCSYGDDDIRTMKYGTPSPALPPLNGTHLCDPAEWTGWLLRHFSCSAGTATKAEYMGNMLEGLLEGRPANITFRWKDFDEEA